jgi:hypothetical protein
MGTTQAHEKPHLLIGDMPAGQRIGPLEGEADPLPAAVTAKEAPSGVDAAAGVTPVGLRPPFVTPAAAHSHPDCRGIPILIVALDSRPFGQKPKRRLADQHIIRKLTAEHRLLFKLSYDRT